MVTGELVSTAESQLTKAGLQYKVTDQASSSVAVNHVISSSPTDGSAINKGQTVTLSVSTGTKKVSVPTGMVGENVNSAESQLSKLGLVPQTKTNNNSTQTAGTVLSVSPTGGTSVNPGATVTLTISGGGSTVPNVVNLSQANAVSTLQQYGFKFKIISASDTSAAGSPTAGLVWQQFPTESTTEPAGYTVTIYVQPAANTAPASPSSSPSPTVSPTPTVSATPTTKPGGGL
jgi:serine/threonine-protein kinase